MSIPSIISTLEKMVTLHAYLHELTVRKEEVVKSNQVQALQDLTLEEKKYLQAINQLEKQRMQQFSNQTVTELMEIASPEEKETLQQLKNSLRDTIESIQLQNELNQQLLQQSLQFVTMTMNTINPQPNAVTYEKPANIKKNKPALAHSMFDSKA